MDDVAPGASLTQQIAAYWANARFEDLPPEVVHAARRCVLDTLSVGIAGGPAPVVDTVVAAMRAGGGGEGPVSLWGRPETLAPAAAALVNGTASHALELDDFGGCGHSGAVVIPAVCAVAQHRGASGRDVLLAVVAGYDLASRVLHGSGGYRPHNERGWHSTGTCGSFGAAAGVAKLLALPQDRYTHALGIAGTFTGGTWAFLADGALTKRFHPGKASETGVSAALLAEAGLTGPGQVLEAPWGGFYSTYAPGFATPEKAVADLGREFHILQSGIKPYACCRTLHSALDAILKIMRETGRSSTAIRSMVVHGSAQTKRQFERVEVHNLLEAQFSAPYCLAVAAESGRATLDQFEPQRTDDAEVRRLMNAVEIRTSRTLGPKDYPSLEVVFTDGTTQYLDVPRATGAPENPVSDSQLDDKAVQMLASVLGDARARELADRLWTLDGCPDFRALARAFAR
jgi:2-methylcitrate dehydratase PrpD